MHQKSLVTLLLILAASMAMAACVPPQAGDGSGLIACPMDARLCPDGSYVGRIGPNCEFAACPPYSSPAGASSDSGIRGIVLLGPTCPVVSYPPDPACADRPFAANLVVTTSDRARLITTFSSAADGSFVVPLAPGEYAIRNAAGANPLPHCSQDAVIVQPHAFTDITVSCDTGIR
jgi:hypothetical protein